MLRYPGVEAAGGKFCRKTLDDRLWWSDSPCNGLKRQREEKDGSNPNISRSEPSHNWNTQSRTYDNAFAREKGRALSRQRETPPCVSCFVIFLINTSHVLALRFLPRNEEGDNWTFLSLLLSEDIINIGWNQFRNFINYYRTIVEIRQIVLIILEYIYIQEEFTISNSFRDTSKLDEFLRYQQKKEDWKDRMGMNANRDRWIESKYQVRATRPRCPRLRVRSIIHSAFKHPAAIQDN